MDIAREDAALVADRRLADETFGRIEAEWRLCREMVLAVTGPGDLLDDAPDLQHFIRVRNPYVDPLSYIQVALLGKLRRGKFTEEDREWTMAVV
jgi:phosphoenolpyruvate carboxylase